MLRLKHLIPLLFLGFILMSAVKEKWIIGKWIAVEVTKNVGTDKEGPGDTEEAWIEFHKDGRVVYGDKEHGEDASFWQLDEEKQMLYISENRQDGKVEDVKIEKMTKKKMVFLAKKGTFRVVLEKK